MVMTSSSYKFNGRIAVTLLLCAIAAGAQTTVPATSKDAQNSKVAALKSEAKMAAASSTDPSGADTAKADASTSSTVRRDMISEYRIGEQDLLTITVWREPELSGTVMVRPDGKITLPLLNDVHASGLTPDELKASLMEKLGPFVNAPQVTVAVREINSRKVFIIGQVGHEGSYRINSTTTVLQIIAEAGGLRDFANRKGIYVLRSQNGAQQRLSFNYDNVIRGKDSRANILLRPGDTIVVP
jgi:polysaccharide biosynthesis/export protein